MSISLLTKNDKFGSWLTKINSVIESLNSMSSYIKSIAPENHASTEMTYGTGTSSKYGHLKLSDSVDSSSDSTQGRAATPYAIKQTYDLAKTNESYLDSIRKSPVIINNDYIIANNRIKTVVIATESCVISIPNLKVNTNITIKNVNDTNYVTVRPLDCVIDNNSEDITLKPYEFVEILQYEEHKYVIVSDNRGTEYNLMNLNLEDSVQTINKTADKNSME